MPDDLLRFVDGPSASPLWWLWVGLGLLATVVCWGALVVIATLPSDRLRHLPGARTAHAQLLRRRYARTVATWTRRHRDGEVPADRAAAAISGAVRGFLQQATGERARYMHLSELESGRLSAAAPVLAALGDAQFSAEPTVDVGELGEQAEELIRSWA